MPSRIHQMLVGLIGRKMREKGYEIVAFDGNDYLFDGVKLETPPAVGKHRPDILGYRFETGDICIGEAKTAGDLSSRRTKQQLIDFSNATVQSTGNPVEVIIGIPKSAESRFLDLLHSLDLQCLKSITYVWMPEVLADEI